MTILVFLVSLCGSMLLGVPVAFALIVCGLALMLYMGIFDSQIVAQNLILGADNFQLLAVPFFLLAGELMNAGGLSKRIINFAMSFCGHIHGGLGYVTIFAAIIMASLSGSAAADTAALAAILIPMMREAGYNVPRAAGLMSAGGIIAPVIPPSIGFIVDDYYPLKVFVSPYSARILTGLTARLKSRGYYVLLYPMDIGEDMNNVELLLRSGRLDGIVVRLVRDPPETDALLGVTKQ